MKKIIALALAILMMAAIAVPAFATKTVDQASTGTDRAPTTLVTFGVTEGYTVTVPAAVNFGNNRFTKTTISASNVIIPGNQTLKVAISSASVDDTQTAWKMSATNGSNPVEYKVSTDFDFENGSYGEATGVCANGTVVLTVLSNQQGEVSVPDGNEGATTMETQVTLAKSSTLYFGTPGTTQSGDYSDTITFTVTLD